MSGSAGLAPRWPSVVPIQPRPPPVGGPHPLMAILAANVSVDWQRTLVTTRQTNSTKKQNRPKAMTSSERGVKFRRKQQERQQQLQAVNDKLRREIARLEALRTLRDGTALIKPFTDQGAPLKFSLEYFTQFREGVTLAHGDGDSVGNGISHSPVTMRQQAFLRSMMAPDMIFCGEPAVASLMEQWRIKAAVHAALRMELLETELMATDNCATIFSRGKLHLRYSRRTIELMYPHAIVSEDVVQKLVGRTLHVPFTIRWYFDERGKLRELEVEPDMFPALYEVLRNLEEVALLLGNTLMPSRLVSNSPSPLFLIEQDEGELPRRDVVRSPETTTRAANVPSSNTNSCCSRPSAMKLDFILS